MGELEISANSHRTFGPEHPTNRPETDSADEAEASNAYSFYQHFCSYSWDMQRINTRHES